jgi:hypothetical protein
MSPSKSSLLPMKLALRHCSSTVPLATPLAL